MKQVAIIGGGISGLAAAHRLAELQRERNPDLAVTLLEEGDRFGGVLETERRDGFLLEGGPDAFLAGKPWALELFRRIGLGEEIVETRPAFRRLFVLRGKRMVEFERCGEELRQELSRRLYGMEAGSVRYDRFMTLRDGMGRLAERLIQRMPETTLRVRASVGRIEPSHGAWKVFLRAGGTVQADALCLALPAPAAASLIGSFAPAAAAELGQVPYAPVATLNLGFSENELPSLPEGFGYLVPAREVRTILGCTFSSFKFPGRAPAGKFLLRVFVGGPFHPEAVDWEERKLVEAVREELCGHLGFSADPEFVWIRRYRNAVPAPSSDPSARLETLERALADWPGLTLLGNATQGVGIPDCLHRAEQAAERISDAV